LPFGTFRTPPNSRTASSEVGKELGKVVHVLASW